MRSVGDYRKIYREIASNLGLQGDSVELLVQFLAQASYIEEVENVSYMREASLESAVLVNSKIQHCVNNMYSVYRGACPRVIMKLTPRTHEELKPYDVLVSSNNFKVYYLGYWKEGLDDSVEAEGVSKVPLESGFVYGPLTVLPEAGDNSIIVIGLLASEIYENTWRPVKDCFYLESDESMLSDDMYLTMTRDGSEGESVETLKVTRNFDEHLLEDKTVFDLTIPDFGSRLYFPDSLNIVNTEIKATYFKRISLSGCNPYELKKISRSGYDMTTFFDSGKWQDWLTLRGYASELAPGLLVIDSTPMESVESIHYRASKNRYTSSIIRSNSDVGSVLEELYPRKVRLGGTTFETLGGSTKSQVNLYYIPVDEGNLLTAEEIKDFENNKKIYYITDSISVRKGYLSRAVVNLDVELYEFAPIDSDVAGILKNYENKFGYDFNSQDLLEEIRILISKLPNVSKINSLTINVPTSISNPDQTYYKIEYSISAKLTGKI